MRARRGDGRPLLRDLGPECAHVDARLRDLARVPDEPALKSLRLGFHVELQREHVRPQAERLVRVIGVEARRVAPAGRSNVSPCQCSTS